MKDIPKALLELVLFIGKNKLKGKDETALARLWRHDKAQVCRLVKLGVAASLVRTETKYKFKRVWLTRSGEQLAWKLEEAEKSAGVDPSRLYEIYMDWRRFFMDFAQFLFETNPLNVLFGEPKRT